jgi:serine/threonine protein kinase
MTHEEFQARYKYNYEADLLGEGGFGEVFKAYDTYRDRWIAIKVSKVRPELEAVRLRKEVEMVSRLSAHPNIAFYEDCYTFREMSGEYDFGILQYYEHGNLQQLLQREKLTDGQKHSLLRQILAGILFLHTNGIIHRDLKPQNILIVKRDSEYIPKITDFGISKQLDINRSSVVNNSLAGAGTLAYSSPEQLGDREIRKNTDLWSFGVIAFQTLIGALPFTTGEHAATGESGRLELFRQISAGALPEQINSIPELWRELIRRCLTTAPDRRIKDVAACLRILNGENEDGSPKLQNIPPVVSQEQTTPENIPATVSQEQPTSPNIPTTATRIDAPPTASQEQTMPANIPTPAPKPTPKPAPKPAPVSGKKRIPALKLIAGALAVALLCVTVVLLWQYTMNSSTEPLKQGNNNSTAIAGQAEIDRLKSEVTSLQQQLAAKGDNSATQKIINDKDKEIARLKQQLSSSQSSNNSSTADLQRQITQLNEDKTSLQNQLAAAKSNSAGNITSLQNQINSLNGKVSSLEQQIKQKDASINAKDTEIARLKKALSSAL